MFLIKTFCNFKINIPSTALYKNILYKDRTMSDIINLILLKQSIFESINRTTFTITSVVIALLVSTRTVLYSDNNNIKFIIKLIALLILLLNILYSYNNVNDFKKFLINYKDQYDIADLLSKTNYIYILLSLLFIILLVNIYLFIY